MEITRKLKEVGQTMDSITTQENLAHFLRIPENARKLNDLVEDIRGAFMGYQVCTLKRLAHIEFNIYLRPRYDEISTTRAVKRS